MNHRNLLALTATALLTAAATPNVAQAQVLLKPNGQNAAPLRVKSLTVRAEIERERFATTKYDIIFQNEVNQRIEADFLYTLPPGAVVTDFAYYYGEERVPARIAEKERAALIYKYITTRMRDPALVEMVGKNTFRARIFPVMPNADLRVQITMAQTLPSDGKTTTYTLPLKPDSKTAPPLEKMDVAVSIKDAPSGVNVGNNYGLSVPASGDGSGAFALTGENYRATKDLRITLARPSAAPVLSAALYAAPSGGADGFFALSLAPSRALVQPVVKIAGVQTYEVSAPPQVARAGQAFVITGRYKGAGQAIVSVSGAKGGGALTQAVTFGNAPVRNNAASKLWAAGRIASLSPVASNRKQVVDLSFRYGLPSKYTSWIAIPEEERKRYKDEKDQAEVDNVTRQIASLINRARGQSTDARALRVRLNALCKRLGRDPKYALQGYLGGRMEEITTRIAEIEYQNGKRARRGELGALRQELARLSRATGLPADQYLRERRRNEADVVARQAASDYVQLVRANRENTAPARRFRDRLSKFSALAGSRSQNYLRNEVSNYQYDLSNRVIALRHPEGTVAAAKPGEEARLVQEIARLERAESSPSGSTLRDAEAQWATRQVDKAASKLGEEIKAGREDGPVAQELTERIAALLPQGGQRARDEAKNQAYYTLQEVSEQYFTAVEAQGPDATDARKARERIEKLSVRFGIEGKQFLTQTGGYRMSTNAGQWRSEIEKSRLNREQIARLERDMARIEAATGVSAQAKRDETKNWYNSREDTARRKLLTEVRKPKPDPVQVAQAERELRATNAWRGAEYNNQRIERLKADAEIDRLTLNPTPQDEAEKARVEQRVALLTKRSEELHARMGDPLVTVDAPRNARQVVALFPGGDTKPLDWDEATGKWQARFDIPTYAREGEYVVTVVILDKNGKRDTKTFTYHVDVTKPIAQAATATLTTGVTNGAATATRTLRLEIAASPDTARVTVALPWGDTTALTPVGGNASGRFFALVPVPTGAALAPGDTLTFTLTDRAHNRAEATAEVASDAPAGDAPTATAARR